MLLAEPERLFAIAAEVRRAVPAGIPFTAKMRLGVSDTSKALDCARALADGGVDALVVHARTKADYYRPPAHWEWVGQISEVVKVPVTANGEVWTVEDYHRCRSVSGVADVMLGRGAVADPFLPLRIRASLAGEPVASDRSADWQTLLPFIADYWQQVQGKVEARHASGRLKVWLTSLRRTFAEGEALYQAVRTLRGVDETSRTLQAHGVPVFPAASAFPALPAAA